MRQSFCFAMRCYLFRIIEVPPQIRFDVIVAEISNLNLSRSEPFQSQLGTGEVSVCTLPCTLFRLLRPFAALTTDVCQMPIGTWSGRGVPLLFHPPWFLHLIRVLSMIISQQYPIITQKTSIFGLDKTIITLDAGEQDCGKMAPKIKRVELELLEVHLDTGRATLVGGTLSICHPHNWLNWGKLDGGRELLRVWTIFCHSLTTWRHTTVHIMMSLTWPVLQLKTMNCLCNICWWRYQTGMPQYLHWVPLSQVLVLCTHY